MKCKHPDCDQEVWCSHSDEGGQDYLDVYRLHCPVHGVIDMQAERDYEGKGTTCPFCGKSYSQHGRSPS
jgi:hypothetical protein